MPKKLATNTKSVEARERKATVKKEKNEADERRKEEAKWADDDKSLAKKLERKQEEERKKAEALRKKAEAKALLDQEEKSIKTTGKISQAKMTRAQVEEEVRKRNKAVENINNPPKPVVPKVVPLEENFNRVMADVHVASNVDQAISVLRINDTEDDKHPEKRMKAAFKAYEDAQLPVIKSENPSLKLSQLKQIIFKNWQKSPVNPLNKVK
ncbi:CLUMA_CG001713, isoform A [Clunio marinus]|uniref:CLUMA_CG001713, isoform A n=1 Tax=Clunio marinus TaxID=568069 RepID=A0A1J1HIR0_9DIPT|nr:CLUMA_CG001713, isoform A [Clunio marinus]